MSIKTRTDTDRFRKAGLLISANKLLCTLKHAITGEMLQGFGIRTIELFSYDLVHPLSSCRTCLWFSASCAFIPVNDLSLSVKLRSDPSVQSKSISPLFVQQIQWERQLQVVAMSFSISVAAYRYSAFRDRSLCWTNPFVSSLGFITNSIKSADISLSGLMQTGDTILYFSPSHTQLSWHTHMLLLHRLDVSGSRNLRLLLGSMSRLYQDSL
jgi:hypothetical protein